MDIYQYYFSQLLVIMLLFDCGTAHLRLTYPLGRTYDLDFLDNVRTFLPCGMPKGRNVIFVIKGPKANTEQFAPTCDPKSLDQILSCSEIRRWKMVQSFVQKTTPSIEMLENNPP